jgi:hypothetical protein
MIYIEAWDDAGNMAIDSQQVYFNNGIVSSIHEHEEHSIQVFCYPNPAKDNINIRYYTGDYETSTKISIFGSLMSLVKTVQMRNSHAGWNVLSVNLQDLPSGVYYFGIEGSKTMPQKFVIIR